MPTPKPHSIPVNQIMSAPLKHKKQETILSCKHVLDGAVWCQSCANLFLAQARATYARALSESKNPAVIQAAVTRMTKALTEFSLTPEGFSLLERQYATLVSQNLNAEAEKIRLQLEKSKTDTSSRNQLARKRERERIAHQNTLASRRTLYSPPDTDNKGNVVVEQCGLIYTQHALDRLKMRQISQEEAYEAFISSKTAVPSKRRGMWTFYGKNGITLHGFFERTLDYKKFIVATLYREGVGDPEEQAHLENEGASA